MKDVAVRIEPHSPRKTADIAIPRIVLKVHINATKNNPDTLDKGEPFATEENLTRKLYLEENILKNTFSHLWAIFMDNGYQDLAELLRAVHPIIERPRDTELKRSERQHNSDIAYVFNHTVFDP